MGEGRRRRKSVTDDASLKRRGKATRRRVASRRGVRWSASYRQVGGDGREPGQMREGDIPSLTCAHFVGLLSPRRPDATRRSSGGVHSRFARRAARLRFTSGLVVILCSAWVAVVCQDSRDPLRQWSSRQRFAMTSTSCYSSDASPCCSKDKNCHSHAAIFARSLCLPLSI